MSSIGMTRDTETKIQESDISTAEIIISFQRKMQRFVAIIESCITNLEICEGVMNKPCSSGCDGFDPE